MVNGPEDPLRVDLDTVGWDWIDWCSVEREVRRLRQRIFKASQEGELAKARSLQKLMLRSRSNTLLSRFGVEPACAVLEFPVSSYYYAKKREADPPAREIRDAVLKEKVMEVWKGRKGR